MLPAAWVYILTNNNYTVLYVGMTNAISTRLWEHKTKQNPKSFTARYNVYLPVYYEAYELITESIKREHYIKRKSRKWKEDLINSFNPEWRDLTNEIRQRFPL
jgi:putative endonuclease